MPRETPNVAEQTAAAAAVRPAFCTLPAWFALSGMSQRSTYEELAAGNLRAVKRGSRTLIDVEHGLAWLRSLPAWKPGAWRGRRSKTATKDADA